MLSVPILCVWAVLAPLQSQPSFAPPPPQVERPAASQPGAQDQGSAEPPAEPAEEAEPSQVPPTPAAPAPAGGPAAAEQVAKPAGAVDDNRNTGQEQLFPELNVYLPEGELDLRLNRLVKKVFVEGQVKYNFVNGDISAFLRYRYYGYARAYQLSVFDQIEFESIERFSNQFDRTRGILLLTEWPRTYNQRTFALTELDRISSNKEAFVFDNGKTNTFLRLGYQIGTPNDERSNAIVGESRARIEHLFTAFRQIGPGDAGLTGALTWGSDLVLGDFDYLKLEVSGIKRFELPRGAFLFGRLHGGTFLEKKVLDRSLAEDPRLPLAGRYSIPREEFFRLDGRDNLKGLDEDLRGTDEALGTWEVLLPWFVGESRSALQLDWRNWYWVLYAGAGTIGFDRQVLTELNDYVEDVGVGFESSFRLKNFQFFFSGLFAQALNAEGGLKIRFALKSYH